MKSNVFLIILVVIVTTSVSSFTGYHILTNAQRERTFNVINVIDGDTIEIETGEKVRLLGINAPEENEHYFKEAKDRLVKLLGGKLVKLESGSEDRDRYGRLLRYIFIDDTFINLRLVKEGYATVYIINPDEKYYLELKKAEKEAKSSKLGLWAGSSLIDCIVVVVFHYDAGGNDNENLNDEYLTLQNKCDNSVGMNDWEVKDEGTNIYTFKGFVFGRNSKVTLYTGSGSDTVDELHWSKNRAVWNNDGDTLFLRDDKGNLVLSYSYP